MLPCEVQLNPGDSEGPPGTNLKWTPKTQKHENDPCDSQQVTTTGCMDEST
jgi:hypothetical protein